MRYITGTRYTQADRLDRDQAADFAAALEAESPLMHLHGLGYDVSSANVRDPTPAAPRLYPNQGYRIGVETLADGRVRAAARGRNRTVRTFPEGTALEQAATELAKVIEGERFAEVRNTLDLSLLGAGRWAVYVTHGA